MLEFWQQEILPKSSAYSGKDYELAMIVERGNDWEYVENPRYSKTPLLSENDVA